MLKVYWAPNTRSFSALWVLEEAGVPYERVHIDIRKGEQDSPGYRAINPMGKVPTIADGDTIVSEQGAICVWLADRYPESKLAPAVDDPLRGDYLRWLFFAGSCLEPAYMQKATGWTASKSQAGWGEYQLVVDVLDQALQDGPWLLGARFTAADVLMGSGVYFGLAFRILESRPSFEAYRQRCIGRPAFRRAQSINDAAAAV